MRNRTDRADGVAGDCSCADSVAIVVRQIAVTMPGQIALRRSARKHLATCNPQFAIAVPARSARRFQDVGRPCPNMAPAKIVFLNLS
jgi:hypothetical protein